MRTLITRATIVNEGCRFRGALLIDGELIAGVYREHDTLPDADRIIDADGCLLLPGVIDDHVHFRDPGLTHKADTASESRAALAGGVTSIMDMPNVKPQTTTNALWSERQELGRKECRTNYAYYLGATNDNLEEIRKVDIRHVPAIKLFMGSSTGNMLVDREEALRQIFRYAPIPIMAHCEDSTRIAERTLLAKERWGEQPDVEHHPWIRDRIACFRSSELAVRLAREEHADLHLAHITTREELALAQDHVTTEACVSHLWFCDEDYSRLGARIKCNPAIKTKQDRDELRKALTDGRITLIATDHAPHLFSEKEGGALTATSGMPMIQFSLPAMLELADQGILSVERLVQLMCHAPAERFHIFGRGFLRPGYQADLTLVESATWTLTSDQIVSKCGWSPLEGTTFRHRVRQTFVNGVSAYEEGHFHDDVSGQALVFAR